MEFGDPQVLIDEIAATFRVPNSILMPREANVASIRTAKTLWLEGTIQPLCNYDAESLNLQLLPAFGIDQDAFIAYDPVDSDPEGTRQSTIEAFKNRISTRNEARLALDLEPLEGQDVFSDAPSPAVAVVASD